MSENCQYCGWVEDSGYAHDCRFVLQKEIERLKATLARIAAVEGCECDTFEGHVCMLCRVRAMAEEREVTK